VSGCRNPNTARDWTSPGKQIVGELRPQCTCPSLGHVTACTNTKNPQSTHLRQAGAVRLLCGSCGIARGPQRQHQARPMARLLNLISQPWIWIVSRAPALGSVRIFVGLDRTLSKTQSRGLDSGNRAGTELDLDCFCRVQPWI